MDVKKNKNKKPIGLIILLVILLLIYVYYTYLSLPIDEAKEAFNQYQERRYDEARARYLEDSVLYSKMGRIDVASIASINELRFETPVEDVQKERAKFANKMATLEESKKSLFYAMDRRGGLFLTINASTPEEANTGNYRIVLTDKQETFCREYLIDLNATQAAIRAGYSKKTANEQGARLLANVSIQDRLAVLMAERNDRMQIDADWVLKETEDIYKLAKGKNDLKNALKALDQISKHVDVKAYDRTVPITSDDKTFVIQVNSKEAQADLIDLEEKLK